MTRNERVRRAEAGFTIIELMVVVMILGVLAGMILLGVMPFQSAANSSVDAADSNSCETAAVAAASTDHAVDAATFAPGC